MPPLAQVNGDKEFACLFVWFCKAHTDLRAVVCYYISTWLASNYNVDGNLHLKHKILTDNILN